MVACTRAPGADSESLKSSAGSVTAEFAILLPVCVALVAVFIGVATLQFRQVEALRSLDEYARQVELGVPIAQIKRDAVVRGVNLQSNDSDGLTCLTRNLDFKLFGLHLSTQRISRCALAPGN